MEPLQQVQGNEEETSIDRSLPFTEDDNGISVEEMDDLIHFLPFQTIALFVAYGDKTLSAKKLCKCIHTRMYAIRKIMFFSKSTPLHPLDSVLWYGSNSLTCYTIEER